MRIIVFGDSKGKKNGVNDKILRKIFEGVKGLNYLPDYIIHLGDITAGSEDMKKLKAMLEGFRSLFKEVDMRGNIMPVFGNHEGGENQKDNASELIFEEVFSDILSDGGHEEYSRTVYFKDMDNVRLVVLNSCHCSEENRISGVQLKWLNSVLSVDRNFKIVFIHIPPYPTGAHLGTSMDLYKEARDEFWSIIDKYKVDILFSGHEHNYSRRIIDGTFSTEKYKFSNNITQIITGGGGEKLRDKYKSKAGVVIPPIAKNHFVAIEILDKSLVLKAYDLKGHLLDQFAINK